MSPCILGNNSASEPDTGWRFPTVCTALSHCWRLTETWGGRWGRTKGAPACPQPCGHTGAPELSPILRCPTRGPHCAVRQRWVTWRPGNVGMKMLLRSPGLRREGGAATGGAGAPWSEVPIFPPYSPLSSPLMTIPWKTESRYCIVHSLFLSEDYLSFK